jgi:hypothetical protein
MSELIKVVVTVPASDADALRAAIGKAGAGKIGKYSYCSYSVTGVGRFVPEKGAHPTIGKIGQPEEVKEERIEVTCDSNDLTVIVSTIRAAHPYEEPAIDAYRLISI